MKAFLLFFTVLLLAVGNTHAQQGIVAAGGNVSSATGSVSYSIGQPVYGSAGNASGLVIQGLQQPGSAGVPLPLSLLYFTAIPATNHTVTLQWTAISATGTGYFTVERSANATAFDKLADVAAMGNTASKQAYSYTDSSPFNGTTYYRLKQVAKDGTANYSPTQKVQFSSSAAAITAAPNPAGDYIQLFLHDAPAATYEYQLLNAAAQVVQRGVLSGTATTIGTAYLPPATYILQVTRQGELVQQFRILKNQ